MQTIIMSNIIHENLLNKINSLKQEIIELKNSNAELKEINQNYTSNEDNFFNILHSSKDAILLIDNETITHCNDSAVKLLEYSSRDALLTIPLSQISPETQLDGTNSITKSNFHFQEAIKNGNTSFEWTHCKANGKHFLANISLTSITHKQKKIIYYVIEDLTSKNIEKKKLLQKHEQLELVLEGSNIGWVDWNMALNTEKYNSILPNLLGYTEDEMPKTTSWWENSTHPDDLAQVKLDLQNHFDGKTEFFVNKHRLKTKSGEWKWFFEHGKVIERDTNGKPVRMIGTLRDINEQQKAQNTILLNENKFRTIFENAPILIDSFDKNGKCVLWNKHCEKTFGWTIDEINSTQNTLALFYDDEEEYNKVYESILTKPDGKFREWHPKTKGGKRLTTKWANFEISDGLVINIGYDITEQKKLELKQIENENRFKALSESTYEAIFISEKGICINTNHAATNMFGYTYDEIIGIIGTDVIANQSKDLVMQNMISGIETPYEAIAQRKDGSTFPAEFQGRMYEYQGRKVRITAVRDITQRKKNEEALIAAKEKAEEGQRLKTAFLQNLSHEIRTPLNGILGFTDLIKMSGLEPDELEEYIEIIETSGTRLINTINDLMDISMLTSGQIDINVSETNIDSLINKLFTDFEAKASEKNIKLIVHKQNNTSNTIINTGVASRQRLTILLNHTLCID